MKKMLAFLFLLSVASVQAQPGGKLTSAQAHAVAQAFVGRFDVRWSTSSMVIDHGQLKQCRVFMRECADGFKKIDVSGCPAAFQAAWNDYVAKVQAAGAGAQFAALKLPDGPLSSKGLNEFLQHAEPDETRDAWAKVEAVIADLGLNKDLLN